MYDLGRGELGVEAIEAGAKLGLEVGFADGVEAVGVELDDGVASALRVGARLTLEAFVDRDVVEAAEASRTDERVAIGTRLAVEEQAPDRKRRRHVEGQEAIGERDGMEVVWSRRT